MSFHKIKALALAADLMGIGIMILAAVVALQFADAPFLKFGSDTLHALADVLLLSCLVETNSSNKYGISSLINTKDKWWNQIVPMDNT